MNDLPPILDSAPAPQEANGSSPPVLLSYEAPTGSSWTSARCSTVSFVATGLFSADLLFLIVTDRGSTGALILLAGSSIVSLIAGLAAREYAEISSSLRRRANRALGFLLGGLIVLTLSISGVFDRGHGRESANRVKCGSNMRQIGQAILLYANENKGVYPPTLDLLISEEELESRVLTCPTSDDDPAPGATTQQVRQNFRSNPKYCSYIYLGAGFTQTSASASHVVVHERMQNHKNAGMNVLYGDGSVTWLNLPESQYLLAELQSGHNPPRPQPAKPGKP